jgi:hypothetical protein
VVGFGPHGLEDVFVEETAVESQGAEHDAVHAGPSDQRRSCALVEGLLDVNLSGVCFAEGRITL